MLITRGSAIYYDKCGYTNAQTKLTNVMKIWEAKKGGRQKVALSKLCKQMPFRSCDMI